MDHETEQTLENFAEFFATKCSAIMTRMLDKGFSREETMSLIKAHVFGDSIDADIYISEPEDE